MAKRVNVASSGEVGFNMTPMIDCTFQLIIFFILASQVANDAYAKNVQIVRPYKSMAIPASVAKFPNRVTVNVVSSEAGKDNPDPGRAAEAKFYSINSEEFRIGDWDRMIDVIRLQKKKYKEQFGTVTAAGGGEEDTTMFFLEVRADERIRWEDVAPVIRAGVEAGISNLNITALTVKK